MARIIVTFTPRRSLSIFHTVSDKNLTRGKAGYVATKVEVTDQPTAQKNALHLRDGQQTGKNQEKH